MSTDFGASASKAEWVYKPGCGNSAQDTHPEWCVHAPATRHTRYCSESDVCVCVCVCVLAAQSCLTLCNPVDCRPPGSSVHRVLQARILEWVAIYFPRGSSRPRDWTWVSCIQADSLPSEPPGKSPESNGPSLILVALKVFFAVVFKSQAMMPLHEKLALFACLLASLFIHFRVSPFRIKHIFQCFGKLHGLYIFKYFSEISPLPGLLITCMRSSDSTPQVSHIVLF